MKIAIIGAGLAGLSTAYFLLETGKVSVTIFDAKKVGGGASGVCSGLLHPYPGISARRSSRAEEALKISKELIKIAEKHTVKKVSSHKGILRAAIDAEQKKRLKEHCVKWGDIEQIEEELFLIHTGITVYSQNYLEGLFNACEKKGATFVVQKIEKLESLLNDYDQIIIAAGYGVKEFPECSSLKIKFLKGQTLRYQGSPPFHTSFISKGYIAHLDQEGEFEVGSTYEREFENDLPQMDHAKSLLSGKIEKHCKNATLLECKAGVRVATIDHYLPIVQRLNDKVQVFTGLGSRGLLYHGLFGRILAQNTLFP